MKYFSDENRENIQKKTMSVKEFSNAYSIGENKSYEIVNMPNFPMIRCGKKIIIISSKVDEWLESQIGKVL